MKKKYTCDSCNRRFGRKWNALRHNMLIHNNLAQINNDFIKPKFSHKLDNKYYRYKIIFDILKRFDINSYYSSPSSNIFSISKEDAKIIKIINQLIKPYNELDNLLYHFDDRTRALILSTSFDASLHSPDPIKIMNETVEIFSSIEGIKRIAEVFQIIEKKSDKETISNIKDKIKDSRIFRMQNN